MQYWKGLPGTAKEGLCGTMDDNGTVPDAEIATKADYDAYIASLPQPPAPKDYKALFQAAGTTDAKLQVIADMLSLI